MNSRDLGNLNSYGQDNRREADMALYFFYYGDIFYFNIESFEPFLSAVLYLPIKTIPLAKFCIL